MTTNKEYLLLDVVFSPDSKILAVRCSNGKISIFSFNGNQLKLNWEKKIEDAGPVIFSPDGNLVICGGKKAGKEEYVINIFNSKGVLLGEMDVLHGVRATAMAFSENGELIAVGNSNGGIGVYKTNSCSWEIADYKLDDSHYSKQEIEKILFIGGKLFIVKDYYLRIWKFTNGQLEEEYDFYNSNSKLFHSVCVLDRIENDVVVVTGDGCVYLLSNKKDKYTILKYGELSNSVYSASFFRGNTGGLIAYCYNIGFSARDTVGGSAGLAVVRIDKNSKPLSPLYSLGFKYELLKSELDKYGKWRVMSGTGISSGFIATSSNYGVSSVAINDLGGKTILAFTDFNKLEVVDISSYL